MTNEQIIADHLVGLTQLSHRTICGGLDKQEIFYRADEVAALVAKLMPAPLGDAEMAELEKLEPLASVAPWATLGSTIGIDGKGLIAKCFESQLDAAFIAAMRNALPGLLARLRAAEAKASLVGWLPIYPGCKLPELNAEWGNWVALLNNYGESALQPRFGRLCGDDEGGLFWHLDNQEAWAFDSFTHYCILAARPNAHDTINRKVLAETVKGGQPHA